MTISRSTRSRFVGRAAASAATSTALTGNRPTARGLRPLRQIGLQLYTLRKPMAADFAGTLQKVAAIGYREVEFAGYFDESPEAVAELLASNDLTAPATHIPLQQIEDHLDHALANARILNHHYLVVPWLAPEQRQRLEQYEALAETLNRAGEQCLETGVQLCYHNHDFEFTPIDGTLPYDLLLELTEPALLAMELDLFWICKAGLDPLDYFARYPGRFPLCHVKDMRADGSMAAVGSGELGFANILSAARRAGVRHYFVEHDQTNDPMASVSESYHALVDLQI